jgi:DtxR family Mn-dependent transcriptional regulator
VPLSRSKQDYVKALYALGKDDAPVSTSELAAHLGVSAPSVTVMLRRLASERLVRHTPRAGARLSVEGRRQALDLVRRHRILETFLVEVLKLDWSEVHADAEILEHHISDRVLDAIDRLIGHPVEDPHGHPIPDRRGRIAQRALRPLGELGAGQRATVREIRDEDTARMNRWKEVGLIPGAAVRVRAVNAMDDVYEIDVGGRSLTIGSEGLEGVMVQMRKGERS